MLKLSILKVNIPISIKLDSLKIESRIGNILSNVSLKFRRNCEKVDLRYKYLKYTV